MLGSSSMNNPSHLIELPQAAGDEPPPPGGRKKATGGGCKWGVLNEIFYEPSDLAKMFITVAFGGALLSTTNKDLPYLSVLLVIGAMIFVAGIFLYKLELPRVSAIAGLIGTGCVTVSITIIITHYTRPWILIVLAWVCCVSIVLIVCVGYLWPFATPSWLINKEDGSTSTAPSSPASTEPLVEI